VSNTQYGLFMPIIANCNIYHTSGLLNRQVVAKSDAHDHKPNGAPLLNVPLQIQVQLPIDTPSDIFWLLQGFRIDGTVAAWGSATGFPLEPMRGVSVFYNSLLGSQMSPAALGLQLLLGWMQRRGGYTAPSFKFSNAKAGVGHPFPN
jgi:hypothetical protein